MGFIDIKLILILVLAIIIYFIYKQLNNLQNLVIKMHKHKQVQNINDTEYDKDKSFLSAFSQKTNFSDNEQTPFISQQNKSEFLNNIVKSFEIPLPTHNITELFSQPSISIINLKHQEMKQNIVPTDDRVIEIIDSISDSKNKTLSITNQEIITESVNDDKPEIITESVNDDIDEYKEEIYSNHSNNDEEPNVSNEDKEVNKNYNYKEILKNLNKYKLPELQDLALEFNIKLSSELKKKTRNDLIDEIKLYISNKNI